MRCPTCNTNMTQDKFLEERKKAAVREIKKYFKFKNGTLYRFNLKQEKYTEVQPYFIVTLPCGRRVTWGLIEEVLLGKRVSKIKQPEKRK
jgi:hypothetical protein